MTKDELREVLEAEGSLVVGALLFNDKALTRIAARLSRLEAGGDGDLPDLPHSLYEEYPVMSAQAHEAAVKEYTRTAIEALSPSVED